MIELILKDHSSLIYIKKEFIKMTQISLVTNCAWNLSIIILVTGILLLISLVSILLSLKKKLIHHAYCMCCSKFQMDYIRREMRVSRQSKLISF